MCEFSFASQIVTESQDTDCYMSFVVNVEHFVILIYTHFYKLMKTVGSNGS
jgi:hypothetical protein